MANMTFPNPFRLPAAAPLSGSPFLPIAAALAFTLVAGPAGAFGQSPQGALTETQIAKIKGEIEGLRKAQLQQAVTRNGSAEQVFRSAAASPKAALELYLKCYKEINFTRLGKSESDWRAWEQAQEAEHAYEPFLTALQLQLQYLSLATRAAYAEQTSSIFRDLTSFMERLGALDQPPHPILNQPVNNTVFAEVFKLDAQLGRGQNEWQLNPMDIGGIYEKTILPYLRINAPDSLDKAWASRIQQETAINRLFYSFEESMERYLQRNEGGPRGVLQNTARYVTERAKEAALFEKEELPDLLWGRLVDQFRFGNRALAARGMLDHIQSHVDHDNAKEWISQVEALVDGGGATPVAP